MTAQSESILTSLQDLRAHGAADVVPHLAPLIDTVAAWSATRPAGPPPAGLAAKVGRLAEVAADAGDAQTAVALAGLRADLEALAATPAGPTAAPTESAPPPRRPATGAGTPLPVGGAGLARRNPLPLLFAMVAASAVSYGVHVMAQARFPLGSLTGWLLSASTTLLAVALSLRVGALLARRLSPRALLRLSAVAALLAVMLAATSYVVHRPGSPVGTPPEPLVGNGLSNPAARSPAGGAATGAPGGADADEAGMITFWWLGSAPVADRGPATDRGPAVAAPGPAPVAETAPGAGSASGPASGSASGSASGPAADPGRDRPPSPEPVPLITPLITPLANPETTPSAGVGAPAGPSPASPATDRTPDGSPYAGLIDQPVRLIDSRGEAHDGTLTGVSKEGVTLLTQVMMFGEPIQAHRQFRHGSIRSVRPR